jgi:transcriptional regulator with XRE-family HTH domain
MKPGTRLRPLGNHALYHLRTAAGLTQEGLAARARVCAPTVCYAEQGKPLTDSVAAALGRVLGVDGEVLRPCPDPAPCGAYPLWRGLARGLADRRAEDAGRAEALRALWDVARLALFERERLVVELRFGLAGVGPLTLEGVGRRLGITRERVRALEARALRRLRANDPVRAAWENRLVREDRP